MSGFELKPIEAAADNAKQLAQVVHDDFGFLPTVTEADARKMADPDNQAYIEGLHRNLQARPGDYFSVHSIDDWQGQDMPWFGAVKLGDWREADAPGYRPWIEKIKSVAHHVDLVEAADAQEPAGGLFVFARSADVPKNARGEISGAMLDLVVEKVRNRGHTILKCAVDTEDIDLQTAFNKYRPLVLRERKVGKMTIGRVRREYELRAVTLDD